LVYLLLYILLETLTTVNISSKIGGFATFIEIVVSAFVGLFLLTNFRYTLANNAMMLFSREIDMDEFTKLNIYSFIGAVMLIIPGFFSDILGVLLQFSVVGTFFAKKIFGIKEKKYTNNKTYKGDMDGEIIDVEVIDRELDNK
jgi:UPF0716 family protein affecting phage T7 exclusion